MQLTTVPVKPRTKDGQQEPQIDWLWDSTHAHWYQWDAESKIWVRNHKALPQWFIDAGGEIPASMLLHLWKEAKCFTELHQQIFWLSEFELQQRLDHLTTECKRFGVEPPSPLSFDDRMSNIPIAEWLEQGLVIPIQRVENSLSSDESESAYDPMQALFEAQKKRSDQGLPESRPFFQTVEQGKFTAKH